MRRVKKQNISTQKYISRNRIGILLNRVVSRMKLSKSKKHIIVYTEDLKNLLDYLEMSLKIKKENSGKYYIVDKE